MRGLILLILMVSLPGFAEKPKFTAANYSLSQAKGAEPDRCVEGDLIYVDTAEDHVINLGQKINFTGINKGKVEEQVPDGCHYTFETSYKDDKLTQTTQIKNCELAGTTLVETLWQDKQGLHYKVLEKSAKQEKSTTCDYVVSKAGQQ